MCLFEHRSGRKSWRRLDQLSTFMFLFLHGFLPSYPFLDTSISILILSTKFVLLLMQRWFPRLGIPIDSWANYKTRETQDKLLRHWCWGRRNCVPTLCSEKACGDFPTLNPKQSRQSIGSSLKSTQRGVNRVTMYQRLYSKNIGSLDKNNKSRLPIGAPTLVKIRETVNCQLD